MADIALNSEYLLLSEDNERMKIRIDEQKTLAILLSVLVSFIPSLGDFTAEFERSLKILEARATSETASRLTALEVSLLDLAIPLMFPEHASVVSGAVRSEMHSASGVPTSQNLSLLHKVHQANAVASAVTASLHAMDPTMAPSGVSQRDLDAVLSASLMAYRVLRKSAVDTHRVEGGVRKLHNTLDGYGDRCSSQRSRSTCSSDISLEDVDNLESLEQRVAQDEEELSALNAWITAL